MHKVLLPINETPDLISYTHNTFISSILSSDIVGGKVVTKYEILGRKDDYKVIDNGCKTQLGEEIVVSDVLYEKGGESIVYAECKEEDSLVVWVKFRRKMCAWENVAIFLDDAIKENEYDSSQFLVTFGCPSSQKCFVKRRDTFLANDDCKHIMSDSYYLRVRRSGLELNFEYSYEGKKWSTIYTDKLPERYRFLPLFIGVCVNARNDYRNWMSCNYIQMYLKDSGDGELVIDYYTGPVKHYKRFFTNQFLDFAYEYYDYDKLTVHKLFKLLCKKLEEKNYIIAEIDHFYIPKTYSYKNDHYNHEVMIYGMDLKKKTFKLMGYGEQNIVFTFELGIKSLWKAINKSEVRFVICKVNPNYNDYFIDAGIIRQHLKDYLEGRNCESYIADIVSKVKGEGVQKDGIEIIKYLLQGEDELYAFCNNIRLSYVLYEHKRLMLERVSYLKENGFWNEEQGKGIIEKLAENVKMSQIIKNSVLANTMSKNRKATMKKVGGYLSKILRNEIEAYSGLYNMLEQYTN